MENWSKGKTGGCIITDSKDGFNKITGHMEVSYYGGIMVCESISREKDVALISAAPDMLEALQKIVNAFSETLEQEYGDEHVANCEEIQFAKRAIAKATDIK